MLIYKITNTVNGKIYIGKTERTLKERKAQHLKDAKGTYRGHYLLYRAFRKYGPENFHWEVIDHAKSVEELNRKEESWIAHFNSFINCEFPNGYNMQTGGEGGKLSDEVKLKISNSQKGKKHSIETRKKWSDMRKGEKHNLYGKNHTAESVEKNMMSQKTRKKVMNVDTGVVYPSLRNASKSTNISRDTISRVCDGEYHHAGGYRWAYVKEGDANAITQNIS